MAHFSVDTMTDVLCDAALEEARQLPLSAFDRYDNPFEQKWTLREKTNLPPMLARAFDHLNHEWLGLAQDRWGSIELRRDDARHYMGLFRYEHGDHLDVHVDAGICPLNGLRKAVTTLLYLGDGALSPLEFWNGDKCTVKEPVIENLAAQVWPKHGTLVQFTNEDDAWHGVPRQVGADRYVLTVSYLISPSEAAAKNPRTRAFFVPRPGDIWGDDKFALRDARADEAQHASVYRA